MSDKSDDDEELQQQKKRSRLHKAEDVFGKDSDDEEVEQPREEQPSQKSGSDDEKSDAKDGAKDGNDSDASAGSGGADSDDSGPRKKKKKKKKGKKEKGTKEKKHEKRRTRAVSDSPSGSPAGSDDEGKPKKKRKTRASSGSPRGSDDEGRGGGVEGLNQEPNAFNESEDSDGGEIIDTVNVPSSFIFNEEHDKTNCFVEIQDDTQETGKKIENKKRLTKKDKEDLARKEKYTISKFVNKLKDAAFTDKDLFKEKKMATEKLMMLPTLITELSIHRKQQSFSPKDSSVEYDPHRLRAIVELGVLDALKLWLDPLDDQKKISSLPNRKVMEEVLQLVFQLPIDEDHRNVKPDISKGGSTDQRSAVDNLELANNSQIGHSIGLIRALFKNDKKSNVYKHATKIIQKWSRLIFKKSETYRKDAEDDDDEEGNAPKRLAVRANREWEKMPENVNTDGSKATKGEFGFRYGASVPRPMLMDFTKQPESKINVEERDEQMKEARNETKTRISNITKECKRANVDGRNSRAEQPELNRVHVGGVAAKVASMGWADKSKTTDKPTD